MEFITVHFEKKEEYAGVYIIRFDNDYFYIGSSCEVKKRMRRWVFSLTNTSYLKNKDIALVIKTVSVVKFDILHKVDSKETAMKIETDILSEHWGNPFLLNRCPTAYSPKGIRPYIGYKKVVKKKSDYVQYCKRIAEFSTNGIFIKIHKSVSSFCKDKIPSFTFFS